MKINDSAFWNESLYLRLVNATIESGVEFEDPNRKGVIRRGLRFKWLPFDNKNDFPILMSKEVNFNNILTELVWFLKGDTNIKFLIDNGCNIWNKDAYNHYLKQYVKQYPNSPQNKFTIDEFVEQIKDDRLDQLKGFKLGDLGPVYGSQWRSKELINKHDILSDVLYKAQKEPFSSDLLISAWNHKKLKDMALKPCHFGFQIVNQPGGKKGKDVNCSLIWSQRSVDLFLGLPYNITSYAILHRFICELLGFKAIDLIGDLRNIHLYYNAIEAASKQYRRFIYAEEPLTYTDRKLVFNQTTMELIREDFNNGLGLNMDHVKKPSDLCKLIDYKSLGRISVDMLPYNN